MDAIFTWGTVSEANRRGEGIQESRLPPKSKRTEQVFGWPKSLLLRNPPFRRDDDEWSVKCRKYARQRGPEKMEDDDACGNSTLSQLKTPRKQKALSHMPSAFRSFRSQFHPLRVNVVCPVVRNGISQRPVPPPATLLIGDDGDFRTD